MDTRADSLTTRSHESNAMARKMKLPPYTPPYIESEVVAIGNGAHVFVPKAWLKKKVKVTVIENEEKQ